MGLDISFNFVKARDAGMVFFTGESRGTQEEIQEAYASQESPSYIAYLEECPILLQVPHANHLVEVEYSHGLAWVRANKWGITYGPLTTWLKEQGIHWEES